jgi:2-polyprenyl-6-methoxyphenol hydroxylase-like FAD-dependent oxidoreductase
MTGHAGRARVLDVAYRPSSPGLALHRAALFHVRWQAMTRHETVQVITNACVIAAPLAAGKRHLTLAGGTNHGPFDLIVDASGSHSALSPLVSRPLPFGAVWGHVPWPDHSPLPRDQLSQRYERAHRMAGVLPIGCLPGDPTPRAAVFWSLPTTALDGWQSQDLALWRADASNLWPEMADFTETLTDPTQMTPARYTHGTLRHPFAPALAFIGDAAHRASPQLGQGANMALLDAMALALALRQHPLDQALPHYAGMRRWHVRIYQTMSAAFTPMYQSSNRLLPALRDHLLAPASRVPPLPRLLSALVSGDMIPPLAGTVFPAPPATPRPLAAGE